MIHIIPYHHNFYSVATDINATQTENTTAGEPTNKMNIGERSNFIGTTFYFIDENVQVYIYIK